MFQSLGTSPSGTHSPSEELHPPPVKAQGRDKPDYTLVNSLLNLSKSEVIYTGCSLWVLALGHYTLTDFCFCSLQDSRIAVKACEGLLLCASLPEDHAATVIILYTPFCEVMVSIQLMLLYYLHHSQKSLDQVESSGVKVNDINSRIHLFSIRSGCKESQFYNLPFGQAVVRMYQPKSHFNQPDDEQG